MSRQIIECEQGTPEWHRARMAMPTASEFGTATSGSNGRGTMPVRTRYLYKLASEIVSGNPAPEGFKSAAMDRGNAMEAEARSAYTIITDHEIKLVGFVTNDGLIKGRTLGASPDGLIGDDGAAEFKTQDPALLIYRMLDRGGSIPAEHNDQLQGIMWVCELKWIDIAIYWPGLPLVRKTVKRDENHIARLRIGLESFFEDLDRVVAQVRAYGKAK